MVEASPCDFIALLADELDFVEVEFAEHGF